MLVCRKVEKGLGRDKDEGKWGRILKKNNGEGEHCG